MALALLTAVTIAATASALASSLQVRMARNAHDAALALAAAETALREGERLVAAVTPASFNAPGAVGLYLPAPFASAPRWTQDEVWRGNASRVASVPGVAEAPRYIVEWVATRSDGGQAFRVTARGVGGTRFAVALVQSVVVQEGGQVRRRSWRTLGPAA